MSFTLKTGVMPPKNVGRKPKPVNPELMEALFEALSTAEPEEVETEDYEVKLYPVFFGPDFTDKPHVFPKLHQASADGRKYSAVLHKRIGKTVKVSVYDNGVLSPDGKPNADTRYTWRLYIPVGESGADATEDEPTATVEESPEVEDSTPVETPEAEAIEAE